MTKTSKLVFFGNEKLATGLPSAQPVIKNALIEAGFEIEQVITGPLSDLRPHTSELAVLAAYGHIIPQRVLDEFPLGIINIHPSLLPRWRGPTPIEAAILSGDTKTGVSIMRLTAGMDEGPIYKQKAIHLTGEETKAELVACLQALGAELLVESLPAILNGTLHPRQQPHTDRDTTYCKKIAKEDGRINWNQSGDEIEREIRAYLEWPKSYTTLAGKDVIITKAHILPGSFATNNPAEIGKLQIRGTDLVVGTQKGCLVIDQLKPAGKNEMSAKEFITGYGRDLYVP